MVLKIESLVRTCPLYRGGPYLRLGSRHGSSPHRAVEAVGPRSRMTSNMKQQPQSSTQEVLAGLVERVTFHNDENGFCVLRVKARSHRELVTVVGQGDIIVN